MISANFAIAVVTVAIRGLVERFLTRAPLPETTIVPSSTSFLVLSGTLYLLYNHLVNGKRLQISFQGPAFRKELHFPTGRISKLKNWWFGKSQSKRPRGRLRENLLEVTKDSERLLGSPPSTYSLSSSKSSADFRYNGNMALDGTREKTTNTDHGDGRLVNFGEKYPRWACGDFAANKPHKPSRTIKTRSGKKYSFFV